MPVELSKALLFVYNMHIQSCSFAEAAVEVKSGNMQDPPAGLRKNGSRSKKQSSADVEQPACEYDSDEGSDDEDASKSSGDTSSKKSKEKESKNKKEGEGSAGKVKGKRGVAAEGAGSDGGSSILISSDESECGTDSQSRSSKQSKDSAKVGGEGMGSERSSLNSSQERDSAGSAQGHRPRRLLR